MTESFVDDKLQFSTSKYSLNANYTFIKFYNYILNSYTPLEQNELFIYYFLFVTFTSTLHIAPECKTYPALYFYELIQMNK